TVNQDGSGSHQEMTQTDIYTGAILTDATGEGYSLSNDGNGSYTKGLISQTYEIVRGAPRVLTSTTHSFTSDAAGDGAFDFSSNPAVRNPDGSFSYETSVTTYEYSQGRLTGASGVSAMLSNDGKDNWTASGKMDL